LSGGQLSGLIAGIVLLDIFEPLFLLKFSEAAAAPFYPAAVKNSKMAAVSPEVLTDTQNKETRTRKTYSSILVGADVGFGPCEARSVCYIDKSLCPSSVSAISSDGAFDALFESSQPICRRRDIPRGVVSVGRSRRRSRGAPSMPHSGLEYTLQPKNAFVFPYS
jgi:hypothetical protein